jgi:long-chain acyl-CoA synthetase
VTFTIAGLIRSHAEARPGKTAIAFAGRDVTYADLDRRSNQAAQALRAAGVGTGDRVALIDRNGPEFFDLLFGAAKAGAVLVPVNWRLSPPEMASSSATPPRRSSSWAPRPQSSSLRWVSCPLRARR